MQGFQELSAGGGVADIAAPLAGVLTIALVTGGIAWSRSKRMVARVKAFAIAGVNLRPAPA